MCPLLSLAPAPFSFDGATNAIKSNGAYFDLPAFLISVLVTVVLVCGVRESTRFNNLMVAIKVGVVLFVIGLGASLVDAANYHPFAPMGWLGLNFFGTPVATTHTTESGEATGVMAGAAISFFGQLLITTLVQTSVERDERMPMSLGTELALALHWRSRTTHVRAPLFIELRCSLDGCVASFLFPAYIGFDSVSCHAEEAKKPERDVPLAICASLGISTMMYVAVSVVLTGMVKYSDIDEHAPLSTVFTQRGHHWAGYLVAIGAVAGMTSVLLVSMLSQPRIFLQMSRDGLLPPCMGFVHPRFKTPWISTILTGAIVAVISSIIPLSVLVSFVSIGTLVAFAFVCLAVLVLRYTRPELERPFRCPCVPAVPVIGVLLCLLLMFSLAANTWYRLLAWLAIGVAIYVFYGRRHGIGDKYVLRTRAIIDKEEADQAAAAVTATAPAPNSVELVPRAPRPLRLSAGSLETLGEMVEHQKKELGARLRMEADMAQPVMVHRGDWTETQQQPHPQQESSHPTAAAVDASMAVAPAGLRIDVVETPRQAAAETPTEVREDGYSDWRFYRYSAASQNDVTRPSPAPTPAAIGHLHRSNASSSALSAAADAEAEREQKQPRYTYDRTPM